MCLGSAGPQPFCPYQEVKQGDIRLVRQVTAQLDTSLRVYLVQPRVSMRIANKINALMNTTGELVSLGSGPLENVLIAKSML